MPDFNTNAQENLNRAREAVISLRIESDSMAALIRESTPEHLLENGVDEELFGRLRDLQMLLTRARVELVHIYEKHGRFAG